MYKIIATIICCSFTKIILSLQVFSNNNNYGVLFYKRLIFSNLKSN